MYQICQICHQGTNPANSARQRSSRDKLQQVPCIFRPFPISNPFSSLNQAFLAKKAAVNHAANKTGSHHHHNHNQHLHQNHLHHTPQPSLARVGSVIHDLSPQTPVTHSMSQSVIGKSVDNDSRATASSLLAVPNSVGKHIRGDSVTYSEMFGSIQQSDDPHDVQERLVEIHQRNIERIETYTKCVMESIIDNLYYMPIGMRILCKMIYKVVSEKVNQEEMLQCSDSPSPF